jgi:hypothetical protein
VAALAAEATDRFPREALRPNDADHGHRLPVQQEARLRHPERGQRGEEHHERTEAPGRERHRRQEEHQRQSHRDQRVDL